MKKVLVMGLMLLLLTSVVSARTTTAYTKSNYQATACDMNGDGVVNLSDVAAIASLRGQDLNGDGVYNLKDVVIMAKLLYQPGFCHSFR